VSPGTAGPRRKAAVAASAGKNASMDSSATVMSSGVPNVVCVASRDSSASPSRIRTGIATREPAGGSEPGSPPG
jgi:hypothetical protein